MSRNDQQYIWRWDLPDDWEPEGYWCVQLAIPGDQQYMDALTGALGLLTKQKSWARDDTRGGAKTVAATWEKALYLNPFSVSEECIVMPTPPIPDQAAADDAAAAIFAVFVQPIVASLNACALTVGDCPDCVDTVMADLAPYGAGDAVRGALLRLCADLNGQSPEARAAYEADCLFSDEFDDLRADINDNPLDWLNKLSDWLFDWLNTTSDAILGDLGVVGGLLGGHGIDSYIEDHGGIPEGGGAGFGGDCIWTHVFDFTIDPGPYYATDEVHQFCETILKAGHYEIGVGWVANKAHDLLCQIHDEQLIIALDHPLTLIHADMTMFAGDRYEANNACGFACNLGDLLREEFPQGGSSHEWNGNAVITTLYPFIAQSPIDNPASCVMFQVTLSGLGRTDPFD